MDLRTGLDVARWALARAGTDAGPWTPGIDEWGRMARGTQDKPSGSGLNVLGL